MAGNLGSKEDLDRLVNETLSKLGGIDVLVYVTGSPKPGRFMDFSYEDWRSASDLLVVSPAYLAKLVADQMIKSGTGGRMVFLSSWVIKEPLLTIALSSVCRTTLLSLVRTLGRLRGHHGCGRGDFSFVRAVSGFHHAFDQFQNFALDGFCDRFVLTARAALL